VNMNTLANVNCMATLGFRRLVRLVAGVWISVIFC
jgi:hypothetical protein